MPNNKEFEMTYEGIKKLEEELELRKITRRTEIADRIQQAREEGDISENAAYDDAKAEQAENEFKIKEIEDTLKYAKVIESISTTKVSIGATVKIKDIDQKTEMEYTLVNSKEADSFSGRISTDSPVGSAIMGKKKGETVDVKTPSGTLKFKIVDILKPDSK